MIRRQLIKVNRLVQDRLRIAVEPGVGLDREAAVAAVLCLENRPEQPGTLLGYLLDQLPGDLVLGRGRHLIEQRLDARPPLGHFFLQYAEDDHRITGGARRTVLHGIGQFLNGGGVVP